MLNNRKILLGISGSIAAYKCVNFVRLLVKQGAEVKVIMTEDAKNFITPLTLSTVSKNPVFSDYFNEKNGEWTNHVSLGLWADLFIIAPATANTIGKMANGICDNLLLATYLSARCPVWVAPAMDLDMLAHHSTQQNIQKLISFGNKIIEPGTGELASGLIGKGRLAEPEELFEKCLDFFGNNLPLKGKKVLVTAGPTYENIDPVRFIGNYSSGKMGFAIAETFANLGAEVELVSGPTHQKTNHFSIHISKIVSANDMLLNCQKYFENADIIVMAAAVADYTPTLVSDKKIKKNEDAFSIDLKKTTDILKWMGEHKMEHQILVGFALETDNELANAKGKLIRKNLDMIVLNSLQDEGAGFAGDTNKISMIFKNGDIKTSVLKLKNEVAKDIVEKIITLK